MKFFARIGIIAMLMVLFGALLVAPANAEPITVNGIVDAGEWVNGPIGIDADDHPNDPFDISNVFYTFNGSDIYFRVDTIGTPTGWATAGSTMYVCLDTVASAGVAADNCNGMTGVDYQIRIVGPTPTATLFACPDPTCTGASVAVSVGSATNVTEIGTTLASLGITTRAQNRITVVFDDPGSGTDDAAGVYTFNVLVSRTMVVDGIVGVGEWDGSLAVQDSVGEDVFVPGMDIDKVFITNTSTDLFVRIDTATPPIATAWAPPDFPTMSICLDTVSGGASADGSARCRFAGMDYRVQLDADGAGGIVASLHSCPTITCNPLVSGVTVTAATAGNVTEFSVPLSGIGITAPGGTYQAFIVFDNNGSPPDDFVLDGPARFALQVPGPTPVTLASFTAAPAAGGVALRWETATEIGTSGFHVLHSRTGNRADAVRANASLIPARGDSLLGETYSYTVSGASATDSFWLVAVDTSGATEEFGPVRVSASGASSAFTLYMPAVRR
jgi:hypothetical protein